MQTENERRVKRAAAVTRMRARVYASVEFATAYLLHALRDRRWVRRRDLMARTCMNRQKPLNAALATAGTAVERRIGGPDGRGRAEWYRLADHVPDPERIQGTRVRMFPDSAVARPRKPEPPRAGTPNRPTWPAARYRAIDANSPVLAAVGPTWTTLPSIDRYTRTALRKKAERLARRGLIEERLKYRPTGGVVYEYRRVLGILEQDEGPVVDRGVADAPDDGPKPLRPTDRDSGADRASF